MQPWYPANPGAMIAAVRHVPQLLARLAVTEASLQRLHGSPSEKEPGCAQPGSCLAQGSAKAGLYDGKGTGLGHPASDSPGKQMQGGQASCCCASRRKDIAQQEQPCQVEQILGLSCPAISLRPAWDGCFNLLGMLLAQEGQAAVSEDGVSCAQHCASIAESLRATLRGLPVSTLGAATACIIAKTVSSVAARAISMEVRPLVCHLAVKSHWMIPITRRQPCAPRVCIGNVDRDLHSRKSGMRACS